MPGPGTFSPPPIAPAPGTGKGKTVAFTAPTYFENSGNEWSEDGESGEEIGTDEEDEEEEEGEWEEEAFGEEGEEGFEDEEEDSDEDEDDDDDLDGMFSFIKLTQTVFDLSKFLQVKDIITVQIIKDS